MKRAALFFVLLSLTVSGHLWSEENLILQRVFVEPVELETTREVPGIFLEAGETLFALINTAQPLIRSGREDANSAISTTIREVDGELEVSFLLLQEGEELVKSIGVIPETERLSAYREFLNRSAEEFIPFLDKVEPEVLVKELSTDEETRAVLDEIIFNESLEKPFEATLWVGLGTKNLDGDGGNPFYLHFPFHYFSEVTWFTAPNHGLSLSLLLEYSDLISYGRNFNDDRAASDNLYVLPGVGYTYRTIGRLSAGFYAGVNLGLVNITAREGIFNDGSLVLALDESEWFLTHQAIMKPFVSYAFNDTWSLKTSFALYLSLLDMFGISLDDRISGEGGGGYLQFLNLGLGYRF
jgi:hypothetical protein